MVLQSDTSYPSPCASLNQMVTLIKNTTLCLSCFSMVPTCSEKGCPALKKSVWIIQHNAYTAATIWSDFAASGSNDVDSDATFLVNISSSSSRTNSASSTYITPAKCNTNFTAYCLPCN